MTWKKIVRVSDQQIILDLPDSFQQKRVMIIVEDIADERADKIKLMRDAANDPLYLADMQEVQADFRAIDGETL